jgi:hypothetical protein
LVVNNPDAKAGDGLLCPFCSMLLWYAFGGKQIGQLSLCVSGSSSKEVTFQLKIQKPVMNGKHLIFGGQMKKSKFNGQLDEGNGATCGLVPLKKSITSLPVGKAFAKEACDLGGNLKSLFMQMTLPKSIVEGPRKSILHDRLSYQQNPMVIEHTDEENSPISAVIDALGVLLELSR